MMPDASLQFWIQAQEIDGQARIVPHVRSAAPRTLHYDIVLNRQGPAGSARMQQSGDVRVPQREDTALARMATSLQPDDACVLSVRLQENGQLVGFYEMNCRPSR